VPSILGSLFVESQQTLVGFVCFRDTLKGPVLDTLMRNDKFYGAALAQGIADVTLLSLSATAYLVRGGRAVPVAGGRIGGGARTTTSINEFHVRSRLSACSRGT